MSIGPPIVERDMVLDRLRGIAILLVVLGHVVIYAYGLLANPGGNWAAEVLRGAIYAFHMPLFMALSGFVLFGRLGSSPVRWISRRALRLLVPYAAWFMLPALIGRGSRPGVLGYCGGIIERFGLALIHPEQGLWFLYVLFLCSVALVMLPRRWKPISTAAAFMAMWALVAVGLAVWPTSGFGLDLFRDLAPYFIGGYLVSATRGRVPWERIALLGAAAWVVVTGLTALGPRIGLDGMPGLASLRVVGAALSALAGICLAYEAAALFGGLVGKALAFLGRRSMDIYVTHTFLLGVWATSLSLPLPRGILAVLVVTCVTVGVSLAVARALSSWNVTSALFLGTLPRRGEGATLS